jgi:hypothetical protein
MALTHKLDVEIIEKQIFDVEIIDKHIFDVKMTVIDRIMGASGAPYTIEGATDTDFAGTAEGDVQILEGGVWVNKSVSEIIDDYSIKHEVPTPAPPVLSTANYTTANAFRANSLEVFLNGMRLLQSDVTITSTTTFKIGIDTIAQDVVTVNYIKL